MNRSLRRFAVPLALVVGLVFTAPVAGFAAPAAAGPHWPGWLAFLFQLWAPAGRLAEPIGRAEASAPVARDAGCMVDPVGRCVN